MEKKTNLVRPSWMSNTDWNKIESLYQKNPNLARETLMGKIKRDWSSKQSVKESTNKAISSTFRSKIEGNYDAFERGDISVDELVSRNKDLDNQKKYTTKSENFKQETKAKQNTNQKRNTPKKVPTRAEKRSLKIDYQDAQKIKNQKGVFQTSQEKIKKELRSSKFRGQLESDNPSTRRIARNQLARMEGSTMISPLEKLVMDGSKKINRMAIPGKAGLLIGTSYALVKTSHYIKGTDESKTSTFLQTAGVAGVIAGLGVPAITKKANKIEEINALNKEVKNFRAKKLGGDYGPTGKKIVKEFSQKAEAKVNKKVINASKKGMAAGAVFIGATAIMDVALSKHYKHQAAVQVRNDEKRLKENDEKNTKIKQTRSRNSFGNVDMGNIAIELFNDRIGHTKMGNARFK